MKKAICIALAAIFILAFAACQTTPDAPVVTQKDMEQMIEKGAEQRKTQPSGTLRESLGAPEQLAFAAEEQGLTLFADIPLELPNANAMPMLRAEAARFSQELVYTLFHALCGDTPMYQYRDELEQGEIEQRILQYRQEKERGGSESWLEFLDDEITKLEALYPAAPEHIERIRADGTLTDRALSSDDPDDKEPFGVSKRLFATSDDTSSKAMTFLVMNDADYIDAGVSTYEDAQGNLHFVEPTSGSRLTFEREGYLPFAFNRGDGTQILDVTALTQSGGQADGCKLAVTPAGAREQIDAFLQSAGLTDFVVDRAALYSDRNSPAHEAPPVAAATPEPQGDDRQAYVFSLLRTVKGIPVASTFGTSQTSVEEMGFGKKWDYEYLNIAIDDAGIILFDWRAPLTVTETITNSANMLSWNAIESTLQKMLFVKYAPLAKQEHMPGCAITLTRGRLSLQRVVERNNFTSGLLIPVWNFYGSVVTAYANGDAYDLAPFDGGPLRSINAIDGSVVDVDKGY